MREAQIVATSHVQRMRREAPVAEQLLWTRLRRRQLRGYKFRRQHPIGRFVADFACLEARLIVEVDGPTHTSDRAAAHDRLRTQLICAQGWCVYRVWNADIYRDLDEVVEGIGLALPPSPACGRTSPASGGGIGSAGGAF